MKRALATVGLTVAIMGGLLACSPASDGDDVISGLTALASGVQTTGTLADMTDQEWDEVYFFPESTAIAEIRERTGIDLKGGLIGGSSLHNSTLVFLLDGSAVMKVQTTDAPLVFNTEHTWVAYPYPGRLVAGDGAVEFAAE